MPLHYEHDSFNPEGASLAVRAARSIVGMLRPGPVLRGPGPAGPVDVAVMYNGVAVDIVHYDPLLGMVSPKGRPVHYHGPIDEERARADVARALGEAVALEGAEYRAPERAWAVPVAWRSMIILHVRVSPSGEILPDPGLQARLMRW